MYEQIAANKRRSIIMIAAFVAVVFAVAWVITFLLKFGVVGIVIAGVFAAWVVVLRLVWTLRIYERIALRVMPERWRAAIL